MTRGAALALMVAAPVLWSSAGVVTRHMERAQPFEQVFWRSFFAFAFVGIVLAFRGGPWKALREAGLPGLFSGALWAVMFTAFVIALSLTTTANTLVTMSVAPGSPRSRRWPGSPSCSARRWTTHGMSGAWRSPC
jgi:drug/metabolite transporter (DMT)-like permease